MRRTGSSYFEVARPRVEVIPMIDIMMFLLVFFVIIALQMNLMACSTTRPITKGWRCRPTSCTPPRKRRNR